MTAQAWLDMLAAEVFSRRKELRLDRATALEAVHVQRLHQEGISAEDAAEHLLHVLPQLFDDTSDPLVINLARSVVAYAGGRPLPVRAALLETEP